MPTIKMNTASKEIFFMILVYRINNVYKLTAKVVGNARKHFPLLENYVSILEKPLFTAVLPHFCTPMAT